MGIINSEFYGNKKWLRKNQKTNPTVTRSL